MEIINKKERPAPIFRNILALFSRLCKVLCGSKKSEAERDRVIPRGENAIACFMNESEKIVNGSG